MELNGLSVAICLMYSSGVMESSDNVKKRQEKKGKPLAFGTPVDKAEHDEPISFSMWMQA